jgi:hypothetical protein
MNSFAEEDFSMHSERECKQAVHVEGVDPPHLKVVLRNLTTWCIRSVASAAAMQAANYHGRTNEAAQPVHLLKGTHTHGR